MQPSLSLTAGRSRQKKGLALFERMEPEAPISQASRPRRRSLRYLHRATLPALET